MEKIDNFEDNDILQKLIEICSSNLDSFCSETSVLLSLLSAINPEKTSSIMNAMPEQLQIHVKSSMADLSKEKMNEILEKLVVKKLESSLKDENIYNSEKVYSEFSNYLADGKISNPPAICLKIQQLFPEYNELFSRSVSKIEDLSKFTDADIQKVMTKCSVEVMAHALCDCDDELKNVVLRNLSSSAAKDFQAMMEAYKSDINSAIKSKGQVIAACHDLMYQGHILYLSPWETFV